MAALAEECGVRQHDWPAGRQGGREGRKGELDGIFILNIIQVKIVACDARKLEDRR